MRKTASLIATLLVLQTAQAQQLELGREYPAPGEAEKHQAYGLRFQEMQRDLIEEGVTRRGLHAKAHGCLQGVLMPNQDLAPHEEHHLQGIFQSNKKYDVIARFSNGSSKIQADKENDFRGMAIKVFGVEGERLETSVGSREQDILLTNAPAHFAANSSEMMEFIEAGHRGKLSMLAYLAKHPRKAARIISGSRRDIDSMLTEMYWSRVPFRHGTRTVKYAAKPCGGLQKKKPRRPSDNYLREDLAQHFEHGSACFDILVQYQTDPHRTPIEDATVEWTPDVSPFTRVASIFFPPQNFNTLAANQACEEMTFSPWNGIQAHRPLGEMNRARKAVYPLSQQERGSK